LYKRTFSPKQQFRINERIFASSLRVLDSEGKQIGVLLKQDALQKARELGVDLVEVAPTAKPPVARLIDYNKFLYQVEKKKREEKRKAKVSETKEVRLGPFMGQADLENMRKRAEGFLKEGNKVRFVLKFRGRQIIHPEFGFETIKKLVDNLSHIAKVERPAKLEGKQLIAIISPGKAEQGEKNDNEENGSTRSTSSGQASSPLKMYEKEDKKLSSQTI